VSMVHDVEPGSHLVHFYAEDDTLASSVAAYAAAGLASGDAIVLIPQPAHLGAILGALRKRGVDPDAGAGVHLLDACVTLARFLEDRRPVPERFREVVGGVLRSASVGRSGVRAYGEMVESLWRDGNVLGALALEELWNELACEIPFTLYCAYHDRLVAAESEEGVVDQACRLHTTVVGDGVLAARSSSTKRFTSDGHAPAAARTFVLAALQTQDASIADSAALVVSELATNAVRHGGTAFSVTISSLARGVRISVRDRGMDPPVLRRFSATDPGGRGLRIVGALCGNWGMTHVHDGKVVWAELDR
jgi:anti-sigma regulatory factor (Ser/Thr protein kinase)